MASDLQQLKLRLTSMPLVEIGCNTSDLMELRTKKHQQQIKPACNQSITLKEDNERN